MRDDRTDYLGCLMTRRFVESGLSATEFIDLLKDTEDVFDTTETTFHSVDRGEVVSYYIADNTWFAKY